MALFGLRDISVIATAPSNRLAVKTYVSRFSDTVIQEALRTELARGGQAFFVHNRVQSLFERAELLTRLVPEARVLVAHGQMGEGELEKRMEDFYAQKYDVLLCTTIIESGLDIPTANTMIIDDAHEMGLAQLYQLRGRVGRGRERAFCYMLIPESGKLREEAQRRLDAIQRFADLGSGFKVASTDLDIRGGGDVLGTAQSGHVAEIGIEMYTELLQEAVLELRGTAVQRGQDPEIKLPEGAMLPDDYVADLHQRLHFYRALSAAADEDVLQGIEAELSDRYGPLPHEAATLMWLIRIKQLLVKYRIKTLVAGKVKTSLEVDKDTRISVVKTLLVAKESGGTITLTPDSRLLMQHQYVDARVLCLKLETLLGTIAEQ
jgi:transcription-repair coupling factor (superfamily II helicase)